MVAPLITGSGASAPMVVITGTGTGIGKTHVSCALLHRASKEASVLGFKPVESGVTNTRDSDQARLEAHASFHVKHLPTVALRASLSPHLAAEEAGVSVDWSAALRFIHDTRAAGTAVLVELPGGLFTPLATRLRNVDVVRDLDGPVFLIAPDRLGVLHDVGASVAAAQHLGVAIAAVVLSTPREPDASTGRNINEIKRFVDMLLVEGYPRGDVAQLAALDVTERLVHVWLQPRA
jgi:dethiobiotin synthetase